MKRIIIAMAAVAAAFTIASCSKELPGSLTDDTSEANCILAAYTENSFTKTALSGDDTKGYDVVWSDGDTFKLGSNTFVLTEGANTTTGKFKGTLPEDDGTFTACYPASYNGTDWPEIQYYSEGNITGSPMSAEVSIAGGMVADPISFKNAGGILRITVKGTGMVKSVKVSVNGLKVIKLLCEEGVELDNTVGTVFHIAMPAGSYSHTDVLITATDRKYCMKTLKPDKLLVINRSEITTASIKIDKWVNNSTAPDGALPEPFTVSANGKKVYLSKGNLYYDNYYGFGFSTNQLYLETGQLSHFYWSKNATQAYAEEYYESDVPMYDVLFTNADSESPNPDFAANGQKGLWRTLSADEWSYLTSNNSVWTTIKGVNGLVIFCDGYTGSKAGPFSDIPSGCAFLPAAGYRKPNSYDVISSGKEGRYLTSEPRSSTMGGYAQALFFDSTITNMGLFPLPESGSCVRLATEVPDDATFTVIFNMSGHGMAPANYIGVPYRGTIAKPDDPVVDGYYFLRWCKDEACTVEWDFDSDIVTTDVTLYADWRVNGSLVGTFTVNSKGKKVFFSKGNLWCDAQYIYHFEENQFGYGVIGREESDTYLRDDSHVSHFMWSKDADIASLSVYYDPYRSASDILFPNATQSTPNPKFTVNGQKEVWRTLSNEEWKYLINNNGSVWATINGVGGRIIFCDGYCGEKEGDFTDIPENCVFLPAVGWRDGNDPSSNELNHVYECGEMGYYLSSSLNSTGYAFKLEFDANSISSKIYSERSNAYSIRLVTEVK